MIQIFTVLLLAAAGEDVERRLDAKISLELRGVKLADAMRGFRDATGLNFVVAEGGDTEINFVVREMSVRSALILMLKPRDLAAKFEDGAVVIRHRRCDRGATALRVYDVRSLVMDITDFPGTDLVEPPSTCLLMVADVEMKPVVMDENIVVELIRAHTGGRSWEENLYTSISPRNGLLFVRQTPAVHREIQALLRLLGN